MASNQTFSGTGAAGIDFVRPVGHLLVNVTTAVITLSFDGGVTSITMPVGFHSFPVGTTTILSVGGAGVWQIVGIQV